MPQVYKKKKIKIFNDPLHFSGCKLGVLPLHPTDTKYKL